MKRKIVTIALILILALLLLSCGDKETGASSKPTSISGRLEALEKTVAGMSGYQADTNVKVNDILEGIKRIEKKLDK